MNQTPRSILLLTFAALLLLALTPHHLAAQQQRGRNRAGERRPATESKDAEQARRTEAIALLRETAEVARTFDDLLYRARIQTLAADALWNSDEERARLIFRRAWEAAKAADKAEQAEVLGATITEARDEVLVKAAARDPRLAEVFLKDLLAAAKVEEEKDAKEGAAQAQPARQTPWRELDSADAQRLNYAYDLLRDNESNSAAQLAAPLVNHGTSAELIAFIIRLREQNPAAADRLYGLLLAQARMDSRADANTVLLLSSPVISPELLVVVDERGSLQFRPLPRTDAETTKAPPIAVAVRNAFYQTAANLLLRPVTPSREDAGGQTQQTVALYLSMGRLLPFFEREAAQYAPELRARASALANELETSRRDMLASHFDLQRVTLEGGGGDPLRASFEQLARTSNGPERERRLLGIVRAAAQKRLWDRARRAALEIENTDSRRAALSFIAVSQIADLARAYTDDQENDYESIIKFLNGADVPPLASAWGYAEAATIAARRKDSRPASLQLLDEAERYAARVEAGTDERVAAYVIVAGVAARLDKERAWRLLYEVVKAANESEDFTGEEISIYIKATETSGPDDPDYFSVASEAFRFDRIFATMAPLDLTKTLSDARALNGKVPQAFAYIAMARAVLDKKQG
jgi:hypothetical protein